MRILLVCMCLLQSGACIKDLYVLGLLPFDGNWPGGPALTVAVNMALEHINARNDILPDYRLNYIYNNSGCHAGMGINSMYYNLYNPPKKIILFGAACSFVSEATAQASYMWNLVQISFGSASPALSNKNIYPRFFRANPPEVEVNPARVKLFKRFGWNKIATIHEAYELFSAPNADLRKRLQRENMTVTRTEIISKDPGVQIRSLKDIEEACLLLQESNARIILSGFYEAVARKIWCEIYRNKLYGPKIVWITPGWYEAKWWRSPDDTMTCTADQLEEAVEGSFYVARVLLNPKNEKTVSGIYPSEFKEEYNRRSDNDTYFGGKFASLAYDSFWAIALALNVSQTEMDASGSNLTLDDFSYTNDTVGSIIFNNMKKVQLMGTAGELSFDAKGDPIGVYVIYRIQGGAEKMVGLYNPHLEADKQVDWLEDLNPIVWANGKVPRDSILTIRQEDNISFSVYICMCVASSLGIVASIGFLVFNIYFRHTRDVKMSSPRLNTVILLGCILLYITPFINTQSRSKMATFCMANVFLLTFGFSMSFGALFAKTWRIHVVVTNKTKSKKVVKDIQLLAMVGALVSVNMTVLLAWVFVDPLTSVNLNLTPQVNEEEDTITTVVVTLCESQYQLYFMSTLFALQGILMLLGAFLAWETRKVKLDGLNDSKMIAMSVYNVLVLSLLGVTVSMALKNQVNLNYALTSVIVILGTTVTQCLIFVPKIQTIKNGTQQVEDVGNLMTVTGRTPTNMGTMATSSVTARRLINLEKTLMERNNEIELLKQQIGLHKNNKPTVEHI